MRDGETIFSLTLIHSYSAAPKPSFDKRFSIPQAEGINVRVRKVIDFFFPSIYCKCWSAWHCSWEPHFSGSQVSPLTGLFQSDSSLIDKQYFLSRCPPVVTGFIITVHSYCGLYIYTMDFPWLMQTGFQEWEMDILPASCVFTMNAPDVITATNEISSFSPYGKQWNFIQRTK